MRTMKADVARRTLLSLTVLVASTGCNSICETSDGLLIVRFETPDGTPISDYAGRLKFGVKDVSFVCTSTTPADPLCSADDGPGFFLDEIPDELFLSVRELQGTGRFEGTVRPNYEPNDHSCGPAVIADEVIVLR